MSLKVIIKKEVIFFIDRVRSGRFGCTLCHYDAKKYLNSQTNICPNLPHQYYELIQLFLFSILTPFLIVMFIFDLEFAIILQIPLISPKSFWISISIFIRKLWGKKPQNNLCSRQSIVGGLHYALKCTRNPSEI